MLRVVYRKVDRVTFGLQILHCQQHTLVEVDIVVVDLVVDMERKHQRHIEPIVATECQELDIYGLKLDAICRLVTRKEVANPLTKRISLKKYLKKRK